MKIVWVGIILIIIITLILPGILSFGIHRIPSSFQPSLSDSQAVDKEFSIKQTFKSQNNNLSAIGLSIKNPYYRNSQDFFFELYNDQDQSVRHVRLNGKNITDGNFIIINFDPIANSSNKIFYFALSAPDVASANSLEVYHSQTQPQQGQYFVNNEMKNGMVSFIYYSTPENPFVNLLIIYSNWFYKFFQDLSFAIFYLLTFAFGLGLFAKEYLKNFK